MKFKNLVIGEIYQDSNGIYRFTGMRNGNIAEYESKLRVSINIIKLEALKWNLKI